MDWHKGRGGSLWLLAVIAAADGQSGNGQGMDGRIAEFYKAGNHRGVFKARRRQPEQTPKRGAYLRVDPRSPSE